jgi:hypothetical protein
MSAPPIVPRYWVGVFTPPVITLYSAEKLKSVRPESVPSKGGGSPFWTD